MMNELERSFSFTLRGSRLLQTTVDAKAFQDQDADMIFQTLRNQMVFVPFSEYLKRYVYQKAGMFGSYLDIPQEEYEATIVDAIRETGTPVSLNQAEKRKRNRVRRWLQQDSVRRETVLLLGFALRMPEADVNDFLIKALHDHRLDEEDPLEAICQYCYRHGYGFPKMVQLKSIFDASTPGELHENCIAESQPIGREASRQIIDEDTALLRPLVDRKGYEGPTDQQARTIRHFDRMYKQARALVVNNRENNDRLARPQELEEILCAAVPRDKHGNLVPELRSDLRKTIAGKRFSRQHLYELTNGQQAPSRYDLITLRFLICSESVQSSSVPKARVLQFIEDMNRILDDCGYGPLYTADPYECFLLMCLVSENPLWTYTDVMEMAYNGTE